MKNWKKYAALLLALVMCLSLAACSGGAPDKLDTIVIDDSIEYDYSAFSGTWLGEKDTVLVFWEEDQENLDEAGVERSRRMYFTLSDANDDWIAAGLLQYSEKYGCVYAHNDNDGHAYKCQFDEDNTLTISSFGAFTKVSGDVPGDTIGDNTPDAPLIIEDLALDDSVKYDYSVFPGTWLEEESNVLAVEKYDDGRVHFQLSDANDDWIASGIFQYVEEYGYVYAHNDFDGIAHICWFDENDTLNIDSFGTFTKVSGDVPGDTIGDNTGNAPLYTSADDSSSYDRFAPYEGLWLCEITDECDYLEFDANGNWQLRFDGDVIDEGYLWYSEEQGQAIYICSKWGSNIDGDRVDLQGDRLWFSTCGYFDYLDGRGGQWIGDGGSNWDDDFEVYHQDISVFQGTWYYGNDLAAETFIMIDGDGNWRYYQRTPGDPEATEIDRGTFSYSSDEFGTYYADSAMYNGVSYRMYDLDEGVLLWDGDTYYRME